MGRACAGRPGGHPTPEVEADRSFRWFLYALALAGLLGTAWVARQCTLELGASRGAGGLFALFSQLEAQLATGTDALRGSGCAQAYVYTEKLEQAFEQLPGLSPLSPDELTVPDRTAVVHCSLPHEVLEADCAEKAEVYLAALERPPDQVLVQASGSSGDACLALYDATGRRLRRWGGAPPHAVPEDHLAELDVLLSSEIDARARNNLAWQYALLPNATPERLDLALRAAERAVGAEPDNGAYLDTLATLAYRLGDYARAVELEGRALEMLGGDFVASQLARFEHARLRARGGGARADERLEAHGLSIAADREARSWAVRVDPNRLPAAATDPALRIRALARRADEPAGLLRILVVLPDDAEPATLHAELAIDPWLESSTLEWVVVDAEPLARDAPVVQRLLQAGSQAPGAGSPADTEPATPGSDEASDADAPAPGTPDPERLTPALWARFHPFAPEVAALP